MAPDPLIAIAPPMAQIATFAATGRWGGKLTSRPLPELHAACEAPSPLTQEDRRTIVTVWLGRAAAERRAADSFVVIHRALVEHEGASPARDELISMAERAIDDELRHAEICRVVASRYAGEELPTPPRLSLDVPRHEGASAALRRTLHVLGQCAFNETTASAFLEVSLDRARTPLARTALRELLSDEIDHARIGWAHLAGASASLRAEVAPWIAPMLRDNLRVWRGTGAPASRSALDAHGVAGNDAVEAAILEAIEALIAPGLERVGIDVSALRAWIARGCPT